MKVEVYLPRFTMKREDPLGMRKTSYEEKGPTVKQEDFLRNGKANFKIAWLTMKREGGPTVKGRTHREGEDPLGRKTHWEGEDPLGGLTWKGRGPLGRGRAPPELGIQFPPHELLSRPLFCSSQCAAGFRVEISSLRRKTCTT